MSTLILLNYHGDERMEWDPRDKKAMAKAKAKFDLLIKEGWVAYKRIRAGFGEQITKFDKAVEEVFLVPNVEIIARPPVVGG